MGHGSSVPSYHEAVPKDRDRESHVVISKEPPSSLSFNPSESYLVSYGIDLQTNYADHTLPSTAVDGTRQVVDAFINTGMLPKSNASLYAASKALEQCKISGMKDTFQHCAKKVGPNGLFVFLFSGHGIKFKQSNEWTLVPADFDCTQDKTHLTPAVLGQWLIEVDCRAMHTLFILDCCYAGGVATTLTEFADLPVKGSFSVLSACTATQSSPVIEPLGHSTFTLFLSHFISTLCGSIMPNSVEFPLKTIFNESHICSKALMSLMIKVSAIDGIQSVDVESQLAVAVASPVRLEADFSEVNCKGFPYANELYDRTSKCTLDKKTRRIIHTWRRPLSELNEHHLLKGPVCSVALCSMMHSIATVELSCDGDRKKVTNVNLSITAFIQAATALHDIVTDLMIPKNLFFQSWLYYLKVLHSNAVNTSGFEALTRKLMRDDNYYPKHNQSESVNRRVSE